MARVVFMSHGHPASATTEARRQLGFVRFAETIDPMLCFFTGSAYGLKIIRKLNKKLSRRICMPMICLILKEIFYNFERSDHIKRGTE